MRRTYSLILLLILSSIELVAQPELGLCKQEADPMAEAQLPKALRAWRKKTTARRNGIWKSRWDSIVLMPTDTISLANST